MKIRFHPAFPDSIKLKIGIAAIEMSYLDLLVGQALAVATETSDDIVANPLHGEDTRRKAVRLSEQDIPTTLSTALAALPNILVDRNLLFHGFALEAGEVTHERLAARGKHKAKLVAIDQNWIDSLLDRIADLNGALASFLGYISTSLE